MNINKLSVMEMHKVTLHYMEAGLLGTYNKTSEIQPTLYMG